MSKLKTIYQCQACGFSSPKWLGKCPDCNAWNSFTEERESPKALKAKPSLSGSSAPQALSTITGGTEKRAAIGISEFDRVLGGGIVNGAIVLIGGDPGIGKSTLLLQVVGKIAEQHGTVLYVSGEESPEQIKLRAERLSINSDHIILLPETVIENVIAYSSEMKPSVLVIDSIQTVYTEELTSAPGSVGQIRESAAKLMYYAKKAHVPVFLIVMLPRKVRLPDPACWSTLLIRALFEGDRGHPYRILRTVKNRFGSTNEIGVFEMSDSGLSEILNPSELFLSERPENVSGSTVIASIEGTRPLLVEIQALVSPTSFGMPRRTSMGIDFNRVNLLVAVLEKKAGINLGGMDTFINVVGGFKIVEPALDLGIVAALSPRSGKYPCIRRPYSLVRSASPGKCARWPNAKHD